MIENGRIKSVDTMLDVLEVLRGRNGARVTEVADELDLSKSSVHDHLSTLRDRGYVEKEGNVYDVDVRWLRFGGYARKNLTVYSHAQIHVSTLARKTGELALLSILEGGASFPIYQARGSEAVTTDSYAGTELPVHCTATGKAMLANVPESRLEEILSETELRQYTSNTITDPEELRAELDRINERGFSIDDEERIDGMRGIAIAITPEHRDEVLGALSVTGPTHRLDDEQLTSDIPDTIASMVREIEINIRYEES